MLEQGQKCRLCMEISFKLKGGGDELGPGKVQAERKRRRGLMLGGSQWHLIRKQSWPSHLVFTLSCRTQKNDILTVCC